MPRHAAPEGMTRAAVLSTERVAGRIRRAAAGASAGVVVSAGLVLSGCAGPSAQRAPTLAAGVTIELAQLRSDVGPRQAQVRVTNGSDVVLTVGEVRVEDPRFDGPATRVIAGRTSTVPAGGSVDIRVQLPPVDCAAPDDGAAEVVLEIVGESKPTEATAPAPDPLGFLPRLHARECLMERVTDAAALAFSGFEPSAAGEPAALALTVTPTGAGAVTVVGVEGTNLLSFAGLSAGEGLYPLDVEVAAGEAGEAEAVVVELPILPARCDPHAVQEDKRGTIFHVRVELDAEPGKVELFVGEEMRGRILSWVAAWCGFGG